MLELLVILATLAVLAIVGTNIRATKQDKIDKLVKLGLSKEQAIIAIEGLKTERNSDEDSYGRLLVNLCLMAEKLNIDCPLKKLKTKIKISKSWYKPSDEAIATATKDEKPVPKAGPRVRYAFADDGSDDIGYLMKATKEIKALATEEEYDDYELPTDE